MDEHVYWWWFATVALPHFYAAQIDLWKVAATCDAISSVVVHL